MNGLRLSMFSYQPTCRMIFLALAGLGLELSARALPRLQTSAAIRIAASATSGRRRPNLDCE